MNEGGKKEKAKQIVGVEAEKDIHWKFPLLGFVSYLCRRVGNQRLECWENAGETDKGVSSGKEDGYFLFLLEWPAGLRRSEGEEGGESEWVWNETKAQEEMCWE